MFGNKKFVTAEQQKQQNNSFWGRYLRKVRGNSLIYFGIPCFTVMYLGLQYMEQFASIRYEHYDRRQQEVKHEDVLAQNTKRRKVDMKEEFYRLQHMDLDNWEQKRVERLPGEGDNKW